MKRSRAAEALDDGEEAVEVDVAFDGGSVFGRFRSCGWRKECWCTKEGGRYCR